jgi:pimeloyl-ACP methyl ester carboxylesterase
VRQRLLVAVLTAALAAAALAAVPARATNDDVDPFPSPEIGPLVAGTSLYRGGAWAWTDYVYDDRGAASEPGGGGTTPYPTDADNSADLVQLQMRTTGAGTEFTALLQTLRQQDEPLVTIALDTDGDPTTGAQQVHPAWSPEGPLGVDTILTLSPTGSTVDGAEGPPVAVERFQGAGTLTATLPITAADHRQATSWRFFAFVQSGPDSPIHDLACVRDAPVRWSSKHQGDVLAGTEAAEVAACSVDLTALQRQVTQLPDTSTAGYHMFLYHSALDLPGGITMSSGTVSGRVFLGAYQPYLVVMPLKLDVPSPMVVFIHGAGGNHIGDSGSEPVILGTQRFFGPEGDDGEAWKTELAPIYSNDTFTYHPYLPPAVVIQTLSRGESAGYSGIHEADVLEAMADAQRRFDIDPDRIVLSGPSMGGMGTFRLATQHPDRFAGAFSIIGKPDKPEDLVNLRNVPFRSMAGLLDPLVRQPDATQAARQLTELGYDHKYWLFPRRHHESPPILLQCVFGELLGLQRPRNPAHVVYRYDPSNDAVDPGKRLSIVHDRAYWVSDLRVREGSTAGTVDALSKGIPNALVVTSSTTPRDNLVVGRDLCGENEAARTSDVWTEEVVAVRPADAQPPATNEATITLTGLSSATFDVARVGLDLHGLVLTLTTDGPTTLRLVENGQAREVRVDAAVTNERIEL